MIMASVSICDPNLWTCVVNKLNQSQTNQVLVTFLRNLILCFVLAVIYVSHKDAILAQLEELREFWDPDTVDLMEWIIQKVPKNAAFTGKILHPLSRSYYILMQITSYFIHQGPCNLWLV